MREPSRSVQWRISDTWQSKTSASRSTASATTGSRGFALDVMSTSLAAERALAWTTRGLSPSRLALAALSLNYLNLRPTRQIAPPLLWVVRYCHTRLAS